jgi:ribosome-associated protein
MVVRVTETLEIPDGELSFTTSRSSGPGGQNVNKVDTRVTLLFDMAGSPSLSQEQKDLLNARLAGRINKGGVLRVVSQRHRTQSANREAVVDRFARLLREALVPEKERVPVPVPRGAKERRLEEKRHRKRVKRERAVDPSDEE